MHLLGVDSVQSPFEVQCQAITPEPDNQDLPDQVCVSAGWSKGRAERYLQLASKAAC